MEEEETFIVGPMQYVEAMIALKRARIKLKDFKAFMRCFQIEHPQSDVGGELIPECVEFIEEDDELKLGFH